MYLVTLVNCTNPEESIVSLIGPSRSIDDVVEEYFNTGATTDKKDADKNTLKALSTIKTGDKDTQWSIKDIDNNKYFITTISGYQRKGK